MLARSEWQPSGKSVRLGTVDDFDWMVGIARQSYAGAFDAENCKQWVARNLPYRDRFLFIRDDAYGLVATIECTPWAPLDRAGKLILFASDKTQRKPMGAARLMRETVNWARHYGASSFWIQGIDGTDLTPLARLCGAVERGQIFVVPLTANMPHYG